MQQDRGDYYNSCFADKELVLNSCPVGDALGLLETGLYSGALASFVTAIHWVNDMHLPEFLSQMRVEI